MPLTGTRDLTAIAGSAPLLTSLDTDPWELKGAQHLQLHYELGGDRQALLPPALHPSIPPTLLVNVTHVPDSEVGAFNLATVRVGCRAGARPRGLLVRGYCDSAAATSVLRERWGYPIDLADVWFKPGYARAATSVTVDGEVVLEGELVDPQPITGRTCSTWPREPRAGVARRRREGAAAPGRPRLHVRASAAGRPAAHGVRCGGVEPARATPRIPSRRR